MRRVVLLIALFASGCKVCVNACAKDQGRAVTGVVPAPDGSLVVTSCKLTTKGSTAAVSGCTEQQLPPAR
ncbi:MAG: hypothetical protein KF773_11220 [Deltaproteobacteria bacterium]|nr:hypothetical protein [Deltaproteobacteria bacterium]MCW5803145.1 hypothetical protein [Deltaproteobacteria bacterium]